MEPESEPLIVSGGPNLEHPMVTEKYERDPRDLQIVAVFLAAFDTHHGQLF